MGLAFRQRPAASGISALVLAVFACGCDAPQPDLDRSGIACARLEEVFALEDDEVDLCTAFLLVEQEIDPALDLDYWRERVDHIARRYLDGDRSTGVEERARRLMLSVERHASPGKALGYATEAQTLCELLDAGRGNCLSLSAVHAAVAERTGLEARFMLAPYHVYVRCFDDARTVDIETTNGTYFPDGKPEDGFFFSERDRAALQFKRPLGKREAVAMYVFELSDRIAERDQRRALELVEQARACLPWSSSGQLSLGQLLFDSHPARARKAFEAALELRPDDADGWNALGALHLAQERPAEALLALERAVYIDANFAPYWLNIAFAREQLGEPQRAVDALWRALDSPFVRLHEARRMALRSTFEDQAALDLEVVRQLALAYVRLAEEALAALPPPSPEDAGGHAGQHAEVRRLRLLASLAALAAGTELEGKVGILARAEARAEALQRAGGEPEGERILRLLALAEASS